ncbi:PP0621 family protein [Nitrosomonas communis]|uniref:PP0621 family protein n=1 Tax=Nitrosomonas communis TaxID=44574 RepID=UPI0026ED8581|nr:PP0621 family protein [Nitrosomonas communis]
MISKWVILIIVALLIYWGIKNLSRVKKQPTKSKNEIEDMVRCAHCGLHIPRSESITADNKFFCSTEHRQLHSVSRS